MIQLKTKVRKIRFKKPVILLTKKLVRSITFLIETDFVQFYFKLGCFSLNLS